MTHFHKEFYCSDCPSDKPVDRTRFKSFTFEKGGNGSGLGYWGSNTVVARARPEYATRQVVTCYDRHLKMSIDTTNWPLPSCQLDAYLAKQAVPDHPANSLDEN